MKPICLICARGGSRGIPNKNIRIINKKPLIAHTIEKAINSKIFSHVVVSTEDKKIARISKKFGAEIPFIRPKNLATGTIPVGDVFLHAIKKLQTLEYEFDTFVNLDCTVPFLKIKDILGRTPNFCELSIFGVMWSEHCSYKNSIVWLKKLPKEGK